MMTLRHAAVSLFVFAVCSTALAGDWPTYRGDAGRSGASADSLGANLAPAWQRTTRQGPAPAWSGRDTRMPFDQVFHPVVSGGTLFYGSSADCKVYAVDAASGAEQWSFMTDAPVRFAPAVWKDRLFVASDDGYLYCLGMDDGSLLWKQRGGPGDEMILGNGRMVSRWPARGGPVVVDDSVYFAAGIWPSEGIFVYSLDAASGDVNWCNDTAGAITMPQPHGTAVAQSGISAQGYLVAAGDVLLVPTGRAVPAALDRNTGKFLYFHLQANGHTGGADVVANADLFLNGGACFTPSSGAANSTAKGFIPAVSVLLEDGAATWRKGSVLLYRRADAGALEETAAVEAPFGGSSLIAAGGSLVSAGKHDGGRFGVCVIDTTAGKCVWSVVVDADPLGLATADGRLFVSTTSGSVYCYAADAAGATALISQPFHKTGDFGQPPAAAILSQDIPTEGYCLVVGGSDPDLLEDLATETELLIYCVEPNAEKAAAAREALDMAGLYGTRVTVHQRDPRHTTYPDYFANLVVSLAPVADGVGGELYRCLRPYGGVAVGVEPGPLRRIVRGPLEGAGNWTHQYCTAANTNCSTDTLARAPLGMLWFTDWGFPMPSRHGRGHAPLLLDGRLFVEGLDGLLCVDAYNGRKLWDYHLPGILREFSADHIMGTSGTGSNFCVTEDSLYIRTGAKCLRIDPASGELLAEFDAPAGADGEPGTWGALFCLDDTLFGTLSNTSHTVKWTYLRSKMSTQFTESVLLFAMDRTSGEVKWTFTPQHSIRHNTIAIGAGRVFLMDRPIAEHDSLKSEEARRRGETVEKKHPSGTIVALDAADGSIAWKSQQEAFGTVLALSERHDVLVAAYQDTRFKIASEVGGRMAAFRASSGEPLWDVKAAYGSRLILSDRTIYVQPGCWDLLTGEAGDFQFARSYGCGTLAGSPNLLLYRSATLGYTDLTGEASSETGNQSYGGIRPGCWINTLPAGGLVLMPDATDLCRCSYLIKASIALAPKR